MKKISLKIRMADLPDQKRWDEFVLSHQGSSPYHLFAWKRAIESSYGHKCYYLYIQKNNEICGVLPLVRLRIPGIINEMVALPFCDLGHCLATDPECQDILLSDTIKLIKCININHLRIRGELFSTRLKKSSFKPSETEKVRMVLNLPQNSDELFKSFKSKLRSQIRKADKNGVTFRWGNIEHMDKAYHVFSKNMHELGSPVHSMSFLEAVLKEYGCRAKLGLVEFQGDVIGMGIMLISRKLVAIPWASTLRKFNRLAPNMLLYWNFLRYCADHEYEHFDFGRSTLGEGTYNFKKQWGAKPINLNWYDWVGNKKIYRQSSGSGFDKQDLAARMWGKLPISVANTIGPLIRKYINL